MTGGSISRVTLNSQYLLFNSSEKTSGTFDCYNVMLDLEVVVKKQRKPAIKG